MERCRYCKHWTQADTLSIYKPQMGVCSVVMVPEVRDANSGCALHEPIMCTRCHKHPAYVRDVCEYCDDFLEGIKRDAQEQDKHDRERMEEEDGE